MLKYLVTGGCGFIGSHLVDFLIAKGCKVRILDDLSTGSRSNVPKEVDLLEGSLLDQKLLKQALEGVDGVFHLAAKVSVIESIRHWYSCHLVNSAGFVALLEQLKGIPLVYASSSAVYGESDRLPSKESDSLNPLSPYAMSKWENERQAALAWQLNQTPSIGFRLFNIYGPRQQPNSPYSGVISLFSHKSLNNEPLTIFGDGKQSRDFVYVKDVARILATAMDAGIKEARIFNLCRGQDVTIDSLAEQIGKLCSQSLSIQHLPARQGEIRFSRGDPTKLTAELGLEATVTLEEGLAELMHEISVEGIV